jgi:preprotein translocase subunit YajC
MTFDHLMAQAVALPAVLAQAPAPGGAASSGASPAGGLFGGPFGIMIPMFVILWFVMIRPQRKKQKEVESLQKAITAGDEVITIGGAHGVVTTVRERTVIVRVAEGKIEFDRTAIATRISKSEAPLAQVEVVENSK